MQKNQNNENEGAAGINNRTRKLIIAGAAAAAVIALLWLVICGITSGYRRLYRDNTAFLLKDVRIENCRDDKIRRSVNNTLEIHGIGIGTSTLPAIPVEKIRNMLLQDTRLSNAEVTRIFPDTLRISVVERQPVAVLRFNRKYNHPDLYVDRDGVIIPSNITAGSEPLPVVIGLDKPGSYKVGSRTEDITLLAFLTFLKESKLRPEGSLYEVQICRLEQENEEIHLHLEARGPFKPSAEVVLPVARIPENLDRIQVIVTLFMEENRTIRYLNAKYDRIPVRP